MRCEGNTPSSLRPRKRAAQKQQPAESPPPAAVASIEPRVLTTFAGALALALPAAGVGVQLVARLVDVDTEAERAALAAPGGGGGGGGAKLALDTALLPPADLVALAPRALVHVFGVLAPAPGGARLLRADLLRGADGADAAAWERMVEARAALLAAPAEG